MKYRSEIASVQYFILPKLASTRATIRRVKTAQHFDTDNLHIRVFKPECNNQQTTNTNSAEMDEVKHKITTTSNGIHHS